MNCGSAYSQRNYSGNRLTKVTDEQQNGSGYPYVAAPTVIPYDANGNMTAYQDKGISSIQYNYLNLPNQFTRNGVLTRYIYRADGVKVKKLFGDIETNYLDGFQYKSTKPSEEVSDGGLVVVDPNEVPVLKLRIIPTSEGYYDALKNQYVYNYTDHLGNVRLSYSDTNKDGIIQPRQYNASQCTGKFCFDDWQPGEIVEVNSYYPFGLQHNYTDATQNAYQYKYNGKELQETGMYDYGARFYMPDLGRWGVVDPMSELMYDLSSYNYANNNPIMFIDPDGMLSQSFIDEVWASPSGTTWTNTGDRFTNNWGGSMSHSGSAMNYMSYSSLLSNTVGGGGGSVSHSDRVDVWLDELIMKGKGKTWSNSSDYGFNSAVMESGILGSLNNWNFNVNSSKLHYALENTKIGKSIGDAERFLFLELPMSFAGGEIVAAGWRAAGMSRLICGPLGRLTNGLIKICFTEGTLVATENGNKKIEDIKEGDLVWSYSEETGKKELKKVVELSRNTSSTLVKISVNGTEITCTPEHPFFVNGNWVEAKNLTKGILLTTLDGTTSPVEFINFLEEKVKVYNFEVEDNHNYYVSEKGILVHNNCEWLEATVGQAKNWISTEPGMQSVKAIDDIASKLAKNDPFVFSQPIKVVQAEGKTFILNGHHRIEAAIKMGYEGSIPYQRIPASQISQHSGFSNISELLKAFGN